MDDKGWIGYLKKTDTTSVDVVWEFYAALLDIADINAFVWDITLRDVSFQLLTNVLEVYMGMKRPIRAFPTLDILIKPTQEDILRTLQGRDVVVVGSFIRQNEMFPFRSIMHLIFAYDIEPRAHTTECPIAWGELLLEG